MMQRILIALIAALATAPAVPARASTTPSILPGFSSSVSWSLMGMELGPWEAYLAHELTPDLPSIQRGSRPHVTWLTIDRDLLLPEFARPLLDRRAEPRISLFTSTRSSTSLGGMSGRTHSPEQFSFQRSMLLSGISGQVSERNRINVSAVLASQHFSHSMLDTQVQAHFRRDLFPSSDLASTRTYGAEPELSRGAGVRLGFETDLAPRLMVSGAYQSRISMDELATIRGVHGHTADLDIPPRIQLGLDLLAGQRTVFTMAVSQVFYSDVGAFPSRALPARFNALLGDSTSPRFEWNDLTVYSFGVRWQHESDLEFRFDYHTRSQPTPSSPALATALSGELAQQSVLVGVGKGIGDNLRLDLSASYAPPEFAFGGNVMGIVSERLDQAVEVSARVNLRF